MQQISSSVSELTDLCLVVPALRIAETIGIFTNFSKEIGMKRLRMMSLVVGSILLGISGVSHAAVFSDDFNDPPYTDGGAVGGTNGWTSTTNNMNTTSSTPISGSGLAVDGSTVSNAQGFVTHAVSAPSVGATSYTLTADVYADSAFTDNSFIGFGSGSIDQITLRADIEVVAGSGVRKWVLFVRGVGEVEVSTSGNNFGKAASISIDFDLVAGTVTGTVSSADGTFTSSALAYGAAQLPGTTDVIIGQDTRSGRTAGLDVDNIEVSEVIPEPGSLALMGMGGLCLLLRQR